MQIVKQILYGKLRGQKWAEGHLKFSISGSFLVTCNFSNLKLKMLKSCCVLMF